MDDEDHTHGSNLENQENSYSKTNKNSGITKEHDRVLPIANVGRIMKKVIPGNGKISKEAKETVQEYVSEFISFVTGEASDKCQREKRKTINGDDIIWAITILGFDDYVNPLKVYLNRYRELEGDKLNNVPKQQQQQHQQQHQQQLAMPSQMPLQQLLHHHREQQRQQQYDQFLQIDQGLLPLEAASTVCSSNSTTNDNDNNNNNNNNININQQPSFQDVVEQNPFSYPSFSSTSSSIQKDFQHQEQIDSLIGQW